MLFRQLVTRLRPKACLPSAHVRGARNVRDAVNKTRRFGTAPASARRSSAVGSKVLLLVSTATAAAAASRLVSVPVVADGLNNSIKTDGANISTLLAETDTMYDQPSKFSRQQLYDALRAVDLTKLDKPAQAETLWRLTRATYELSQDPNLSKEAKDVLVKEAYGHVQVAIAADDGNFKCHSWYGIILNEIGDIEGTKKKISYLYIVKEHWLRAAELNPADATSLHLLGRWCYGIVTISSAMYWAARALFGKLPDTSWDEAYGYFKAAEELDPGFWKKNVLMLGICAKELGQLDEAREHLKKALLIPIKTHEDRESHAEAKELLKNQFQVTDASEWTESEGPSTAVPVESTPVEPVKKKAPHGKMGFGFCPAGYSSSDPAQQALAQANAEQGTSQQSPQSAVTTVTEGAPPSSEQAASKSNRNLYAAMAAGAGAAAVIAHALFKKKD